MNKIESVDDIMEWLKDYFEWKYYTEILDKVGGKSEEDRCPAGQ